MDRKNFLRNAARFFFLGALAGGTVYLVNNEKITSPGNCDINNQCSGCGSFSGCSLPQALNERTHGK